MEQVVISILIVMSFYLVSGLLFSILFLIIGLQRVDDGTNETSLFFKMLILPGVVLLWPLLLQKWIKSKQQE